MRLIDADKLKKDVMELWDYKTVDGITATTVLKQTITDIENQPTVEAIPIEWINSYTTGLIFSDDYVDNADSIDDYIYCIKEMVRDWRKEND